MIPAKRTSTVNHLKKTGETIAQFAKRAGVQRSAISRLIHHGTRMGWKSAHKIHEASEGAIKIEDIASI